MSDSDFSDVDDEFDGMDLSDYEEGGDQELYEIYLDFRNGEMDPDEAEHVGSTMLEMTISQGDEQAARDLLTAGVNPNGSVEMGRTPLHHALERDENGIVQALLDAGADPDLADANGHTALYWAVDAWNQGGFDLLLRAGAARRLVDDTTATDEPREIDAGVSLLTPRFDQMWNAAQHREA